MIAASSPSAERDSARTAWLLLTLVLALAAFVQLTVVSRTVVEHPLRADAGEYFAYAWNLSNHGVYSSAPPTGDPAPAPAPDKVRSPGYPLFLLAVGSPQPTEAYLRRVAYAQALLGVGSVLFAYLIAAGFLGRWLALVPALLTATSPHLAMTSTYLLSEAPFTFLLLAATYVTQRAASGGNLRTAALAGIAWAACSLVRPTVEFLPPALLLLALVLPGLRQFRRPAAVLTICFVAAMAPWAVRNLGVETPGPSLMINSVAHGAYPDFMFEERPETFGFPYRFDPDYPGHVTSAGALIGHLGERFTAEPGRYAKWFLLGKPYYLLSLKDVQAFDIQIYPTPANPYYERPAFAWMRGTSIALHAPLMVAGMLGLLLVAIGGYRPQGRAAQGWVAAAVVGLVVLYAIGIHMVAAPFPRYAIPFRPLIYALAMIPILFAWRAWRSDRRA